MNRERKDYLVEKLKQYQESKNLSQADLHRETGIPERYLIEILKKNYEYETGREIPKKYFMIIEDYLSLTKDRQSWRFVTTTQALQIMSVLEDAKEFGYTNIIIGETGSGKSYLTDLFVRKYPKDSFVITVGSADTIADLLDKILDALKLPQGKSKSKKIGDIIKKLIQMRYDGFNPIIIFDEAEYMKQATLCNMKELHDHLVSKCGVVMIGTDQLLINLDRLRKKNKQGIPQFFRRVKFGIRNLTAIDTRFLEFFKELKITDRALIKFLQQNCDNYGELRDALLPALRESERTGEPLTESFLRRVLQIPNSN